MELPTYTSIWRIEKRLYKLYDFRLPMPLPVGQIVVFAAITVPYVLALTLLGLPFSHSLFWLYVLPPGAMTWLATRPVLESKRLPELALSHLRYLAEPSTWCRMAPLAERDEILVQARVWRRAPAAAEPGLAAAQAAGAAPSRTAEAPARPALGAAPARASAPGAAPAARAAGPAAGGGASAAGAAGHAPRQQAPMRARQAAAGVRVPPPARPLRETGAAGRAQAAPSQPPRVGWGSAAGPAAARPAPVGHAPPGPAPARPAAAGPAAAGPAAGSRAAQPPARGGPPPVGAPSVIVVPARPSSAAPRPLPPARAVERALSGPPSDRSVSWRDRVLVVPGGRGPHWPDFEQRDTARAVSPLRAPRLVVVLGCTVGAGQTVTALMLADLLAGLRGEPVAALDANPGPASLVRIARSPAIMADALLATTPPGAAHARPRGRGRLDLVVSDSPQAVADDGGRGRLGRVVGALRARYQLTLADPGAAVVAPMLAAADQLVLVAPASPEASRAVAMTCEWLGANGYHALAARAVAVLNGVSKRSLPHAQQAEAVVRGGCRAIVRIPWDDHLAGPEGEQAIRDAQVSTGGAGRLGQLRPPVRQAYTALAGVVVAALADGERRQRRAAR